MPEFQTLALPAEPLALAPDGTRVRVLLALDRGSLAHFELPAGAVSHAVKHRTVEEIWYFLSGRGEVWRADGKRETIEPVGPGLALTMPLGTAFQFRALGAKPLIFLAITMPPWPGPEEAFRLEGPWRASLP
jgi:mannose-6-phosphate isomerase-like protein (cupin superfamily)